ncbi:hypothetical protein BpHYR1_001201 [Brachionus plicatilis]|uniref:Uncharacterized protein n=1 Tax=Brachionus plicatilis TaxID=10195 RepID=A0A3M7PAK6_BRAPC|nr:hypothetical protein BpHYR1_001201 [Brachionus plicatilis]
MSRICSVAIFQTSAVGETKVVSLCFCMKFHNIQKFKKCDLKFWFNRSHKTWSCGKFNVIVVVNAQIKDANRCFYQ